MRGRPEPDEYGAHAAADIARVAGDDAVAALAAQALEVENLFGSLDESAIAGLRYAPGKWTPKEILGHLIDDERIFAYRALCIARGDTRPLESFDENAYMAGANFEERPLADLLREYVVVRAATIALFASLPDEAWLRRGMVAGYTASVRGLAFHISGHELHHLFMLREKYAVG
jgi:DinB superfamily